jgi:hypothetical protein
VIQRLIGDGVVYLSAEPGKESQACGALDATLRERRCPWPE